MTDPEASIVFEPQPRAAAWLYRQIDTLTSKSPIAQALSSRLLSETGTRFADWVERITLPGASDSVAVLSDLGFVAARQDLFVHPGAILPVVELGDEPALSLRVEDVDQVSLKLETVGEPRGEPYAPTRSVGLAAAAGFQLRATERHNGRLVSDFVQPDPSSVQQVLAAFENRKRDDAEPARGFERARELIRSAQQVLPKAYVCDLFFRAERSYWASRNDAARVQKARQDGLGFGWGNHDHHTYRSSRECFQELVTTLELVGLSCRERFYAGKEAGWGAQVMEHAESGLMVFADVDLGPEEVLGDFSHQGLSPRAGVGTVGLWCALHGEAFLEAGMHHLEAQFDFNEACRQLSSLVGVMPPFTDFEYLKQCFTRGQNWPVSVARSQQAVSAGWISPGQAEQFRASGAIGSHLEILERNQGFKGFNQTGISEIITVTDPRLQRVD